MAHRSLVVGAHCSTSHAQQRAANRQLSNGCSRQYHPWAAEGSMVVGTHSSPAMEQRRGRWSCHAVVGGE